MNAPSERPPLPLLTDAPPTYASVADVVTDHEDQISTTCLGILAEIRNERTRAHEKHGHTSMECLPVADLTRLTVLMEEVGEVARWFNESRRREMPRGELRAELIQVAAMAAAWADALTDPHDMRHNHSRRSS